jgi:phosphoribosyl-ATP pyrophosphohydrolase
MLATTLQRIYDTILQRRNADSESSYVASLFAKGHKKIAQKIGEEATEVVLAASGGERREIISESADLLFHLMVLWAAHGIAPDNVAAELSAREGMSGIDEKAQRKKP